VEGSSCVFDRVLSDFVIKLCGFSRVQMARRVLPERFAGEGDFDEFKFQFERAAKVNKWDDDDKCTYLGLCLTGNALKAFRALTGAVQDNYAQAIAALEAKFQPKEKSEVYKIQFETRGRIQGEELSALATNLELLVQRAYPGLPLEAHDDLAKGRFLACLDPSIRLACRQSRPKNLQEAVGVAYEIEGMNMREGLATKKHCSCIHPSASSEEPVCAAVGNTAGNDQMAELLRANMIAMQKMTEALQEFRVNASASGNQRDRRQRVCYGCGKPGHFRAQCPNSVAGNGLQSGRQNPGNGRGLAPE
jgi:hypothetical protein